MSVNLIPVITALIGVLVGGGLKALGTHLARRHDARTLLSGLVAEVEACVRLARHRGYLEQMTELQEFARQMIDSGHGGEPAPWFEMTTTGDYFAIFHASLSKIGLLSAYHADRITRFHMLARATLENSSASSPWQKGITAEQAHSVLENDIQLLIATLLLGEEIASFRKITVPAAMDKIGTPPPIESGS